MLKQYHLEFVGSLTGPAAAVLRSSFNMHYLILLAGNYASNARRL